LGKFVKTITNPDFNSFNKDELIDDINKSFTNDVTHKIFNDNPDRTAMIVRYLKECGYSVRRVNRGKYIYVDPPKYAFLTF